MRTSAVILRIIRQFLKDKRTIALLFAAPLLVLTLMSYVFNSNSTEPRIGAVNAPEAVVQKLSEQRAKVSSFTREQAAQELQRGGIDAVLEFEGMKPSLTLEGSDPTVNKAVLMLLNKTMAGPQPANAPALSVTYLHGSEKMELFDSLGPVLIGFFCFFFVFLIAGVSFLRERTNGTLERLLASPIRRWELVLGYVVGFGLFTMIQAALITWYTIYVLGMMMSGSIGYVLLVTLLLSLTALTLGTLISAFANNEFQMIQFIPIVIVPQIFFSGLFRLENMAGWLQWLSKLMPLYYGADALRNVMVRGKGWADISFDVYVLAAFSIVFMLLNVLALRKHRKI